MSSISVVTFVAETLREADVAGKRVIEVGSRGYSSSRLLTGRAATAYIGTDKVPGPNVDRVCMAQDLVRDFGEAAFDVVISTETLEHVLDWKGAVSNMKRLCRPGGLVVLTTRSRGYRIHGAPRDYWRFDCADMARIFGDFTVESCREDDLDPGVFLCCRRPEKLNESDLSQYELYSVVSRKRTLAIASGDYWNPIYVALACVGRIADFVEYALMPRISRIIGGRS
jgi:SAM-dependent methyltransferase